MSDDFDDLRRLVVDLERAPERVHAQSHALVKRGAQNMKADWADQWADIKGMPAIGRAVDYDIRLAGLTAIEAEVGPNKDRKQGPLGNIAEFGSSQHPPIRPAGKAVLSKEAANLERLLSEVADPL
jgi:hypothetical protein